MENTIHLNKGLSLAGIAKKLTDGEPIAFTESHATIIQHCPVCGKPLLCYPHNTHWLDTKYVDDRLEQSGQPLYIDGDTITIQEAEEDRRKKTYDYLGLDAELLIGECPYCRERFGLVEAYCFDSLPDPRDPSNGDPDYFIVCRKEYNDLVYSIAGHRNYVVSLGGVPIGVMHYGKEVRFSPNAFGGFPRTGFVSDCCVFSVNCNLEDDEKRDEWEAAADIALALYRKAKQFMNGKDTYREL